MMRRPEPITSAANPLLKDIRRAVSRGGLTSRGWCVAETPHLLEEALRSRCAVRSIIAGESVISTVGSQVDNRDGVRLAVVPDRLLDASSQGVVALVEPPAWRVQQTLGDQPGTKALVLVLDGVQDPGNMGTILRSAEAFGATGVLLLKGTVNVFNAKAMRASAGSVFRVPFVQGLDEDLVLPALRDAGADLYAAVPGSPNPAADADLTRACAMLIGSEGHGIRPTLRRAAKDLSIPTSGVESLNAAISAAILLYEARRQRSRHA